MLAQPNGQRPLRWNILGVCTIGNGHLMGLFWPLEAIARHQGTNGTKTFRCLAWHPSWQLATYVRQRVHRRVPACFGDPSI